GFPVEEALRISVGEFFYPFGWSAGCIGIEQANTDQVWRTVDRLQRRCPINLLIRGDTVFIYARRPGIELTSQFPSNVMAFFELSGVVLVSDERVFAALTEALVATAMQRTGWPIESILE